MIARVVLVALGALAAATALDYAAAKYNRALRDDDWHRAGLWSIAMSALSSYCILAVTKYAPEWASEIMLLPEFAGLYVGTRLAGLRASAPQNAR